LFRDFFEPVGGVSGFKWRLTKGMKKLAFVFTDEYFRLDYGPTHPLKMDRLKAAYNLMRVYGLLDHVAITLTKPLKADEQDILTYHSPDYVNVLKQANEGEWNPSFLKYGLGPGDNPVFKGLWDGSLLVCGGALVGAKKICEKEVETAFNIAGGLHHAHPSRASGFCYLNDPVLAIMYLNRQGFRIAYVDIDAHHGDGVQEAFYQTDQVLTVSIHQDGSTLFPGTGFIYETGRGQGEGHSINVPLLPGADDDVFKEAIDSIVLPFVKAFKPDILVTQLGVDTFRHDPLASLNLTTNGFCYAVSRFKDLSLPWLALGGGGYDISNVARAWTLALGIMLDMELNDELPPEGKNLLASYNYTGQTLRDAPYFIPRHSKEIILRDEREKITWLKQSCLPKISSLIQR
jgi:acetoin utilization protein AcuC